MAHPDVVYFSSVSGNTHRFVERLADAVPGLRTRRLPLRGADPEVTPEAAYILITPTYGGGAGGGGAVPKQVIRFLGKPANRALLRGVVATGNTNFGADYTRAGDIIARKCQVPLLARVELFGTPDDVARVARIIQETNP